eukprot:CAMPEP_0114488088 /NCGR_PEP_ID=MMETSP0109-20121206/1130_1 /TAXON_ID=29199 /ORGANISM="Chlorarachnion reptans, Strain CCCM449" /LENGTH=571 /DNA_ID=CAMNT_0001664431 /DNA_START=5 /DNA_END=1718 /DNA_ORIENTATION=+
MVEALHQVAGPQKTETQREFWLKIWKTGSWFHQKGLTLINHLWDFDTNRPTSRSINYLALLAVVRPREMRDFVLSLPRNVDKFDPTQGDLKRLASSRRNQQAAAKPGYSFAIKFKQLENSLEAADSVLEVHSLRIPVPPTRTKALECLDFARKACQDRVDEARAAVIWLDKQISHFADEEAGDRREGERPGEEDVEDDDIQVAARLDQLVGEIQAIYGTCAEEIGQISGRVVEAQEALLITSINATDELLAMKSAARRSSNNEDRVQDRIRTSEESTSGHGTLGGEKFMPLGSGTTEWRSKLDEIKEAAKAEVRAEGDMLVARVRELTERLQEEQNRMFDEFMQKALNFQQYAETAVKHLDTQVQDLSQSQKDANEKINRLDQLLQDESASRSKFCEEGTKAYQEAKTERTRQLEILASHRRHADALLSKFNEIQRNINQTADAILNHRQGPPPSLSTTRLTGPYANVLHASSNAFKGSNAASRNAASRGRESKQLSAGQGSFNTRYYYEDVATETADKGFTADAEQKTQRSRSPFARFGFGGRRGVSKEALGGHKRDNVVFSAVSSPAGW